MPLDADALHQRDRREVKKPVEAIAIKPLSGRLTLLTRKLYNVLLCHAQEQGTAVDKYLIPLSELARDAHFDSRDTALIKDHLQAMQTTLVEWSNSLEWGSSQLIGEIRIFKNAGDGNLLWLEWQYLPTLKEKLIEPARYARLALRFQGLLRSGAALALYETAVRYATNPSHLTNRLPWEEWAHLLSGNPDRQFKDYKYAKRDLFRLAIAEVNALTDVRVDLIEHKRGRRVVQLQFRVEPTTPILERGSERLAQTRIDLSLVHRMCSLGLSQSDAEEIFCKAGEQVARESLEYVERRLKVPPPVKTPAALFRWAVRHPEVRGDGRSDTQQAERQARQKAIGRVETDSRIDALRAAFRAQRIEEVQNIFSDYPQAEKEVLLREFEETELAQRPRAIQRSFRESGLQTRMVSVAFFEWMLAKEGRAAASEGELLQFAAGTRRLATTPG